MGLKFQPPNFAQPQQYPDIASGIESIFSDYHRMKMQESQMALQAEQLRGQRFNNQAAEASFALQNQGLTPQFINEHMSQALQPAPYQQAPQPSFNLQPNPNMMTPPQAQQPFPMALQPQDGQIQNSPAQEHPGVGYLRQAVGMHMQQAQLGMAGQVATVREKEAQANQLNAQADAMRQGPRREVIDGIPYLITPSPTGPHYTPIPDRTPAQSEQAARGFADKAQQAHDMLAQLEMSGANPGSLETGLQSMLPNVMQSEKIQGMNQSRRQFINAILRRESGAAVTESEWSNYGKQYFPSPGDSKDVMAQKARSRELAIANLKQEGARVPSQYQRQSQPGSEVRVQMPDGSKWSVPANKVNEALKRGARRIQ
ncbi:MAG: hypothetical protein HY078_10430 [Elusimicrobia bacterium]|nr:hypothetical protein [Elusimicrobiota bacterium]